MLCLLPIRVTLREPKLNRPCLDAVEQRLNVPKVRFHFAVEFERDIPAENLRVQRMAVT